MSKEDLLAILKRVYDEERDSGYEWVLSKDLCDDIEYALKEEDWI